jgi:thioredoxin reductase
MRRFHVAIVGGGIGGAACALRAAQHGLDLCWIYGDASTAKAGRAKYVVNVDNMIGVHEGIGKRKILEALSGPEHAAARAAIAASHFHIGTQDIIDNVEERLRREYPDVVTIVYERAVGARRDAESFAVVTSSGVELQAGALVLATGVMDRQPKVKRTKRSGQVDDEVPGSIPGPTRKRSSIASSARGTWCAAPRWPYSGRLRPRRRSRSFCTSVTACPSRCSETERH